MKTVLKDYTLWFDGEISVSPSNLENYIQYAGKMHCDTITSEITQYNKLVSSDQKIAVKQQLDNISNAWNIPQSYLDLDVLSLICANHVKLKLQYGWNDSEYSQRKQRIIDEYVLFERDSLIPLLQVLTYIVDNFEENSIVWGPGRGSSVSSYILYILHIHDVDSVLYQLDIADFL